jgi:hypothetical protein
VSTIEQVGEIGGEPAYRVGDRVVTLAQLREEAAKATLAKTLEALEREPRGEAQADPATAPKLLRAAYLDHKAQARLVAAGVTEPTQDEYAAALVAEEKALDKLERIARAGSLEEKLEELRS